MQSATFGPTPGSVSSVFLTLLKSFSFFNCSKSTSLFFIILVVSYTLTSLNPKPSALKSSTLAFESSSIVGKV